MDIIINIAVFLISAVIFTALGMYVRKKIAESKMESAENEAKRIIELASKEAENKKKEDADEIIIETKSDDENDTQSENSSKNAINIEKNDEKTDKNNKNEE